MAWPGGPQQLLVFSRMPLSARLHFCQATKTLFCGVLGWYRFAATHDFQLQELKPSGARARFAAAFTAMRLLWLMTSTALWMGQPPRR